MIKHVDDHRLGSWRFAILAMLVQRLRQHNGGAGVAGPMRGHVGVAEGLDIVVFEQSCAVDHRTDGTHLMNDLGQERFGCSFVRQIGLENTRTGICVKAIQSQAILRRLQSFGI